MISVALSPKRNELAVAAAFSPNEKPLVKFCEIPPRRVANLPLLVEDVLKEVNLTINDVTHWTINSGPGNFTFLRQIASLVSGWSFGKQNVHTRAIPGPLMLASEIANEIANSQDGRAGVLYDCRNQEVFYFGIKYVDGKIMPSGETMVFKKEEIAQFYCSHPNETIIINRDDFVLLDFDKSKVVDENPAVLLGFEYIPFDNDLTKLLYIRPAVVKK